jgi:hypothetical protein
MSRPLLILCTILLVCFNSLLASAAVISYSFKPSDEPSFGYSGGDLVWVNVAAQLSGQVSISIDENTGAADLRFENVVIHSVFSTIHELNSEPPEQFTAEFYEGKSLTDLDAFDYSIPGQRVSPTEIKFGPTISEGTIRYQQHFRFRFDGNAYRLSGGSFHCDDCPNYHIYGQLIPIPEPSTFGGLIAALACLASWRSRRARPRSRRR